MNENDLKIENIFVLNSDMNFNYQSRKRIFSSDDLQITIILGTPIQSG